MLATGDLLPEESVQLTDAVLANLTEIALSDADLFAFGDDEEAGDTSVQEKRTINPKCKTFPGDALWPHNIAWTVLDLLTGGRLIKTVPIAASCYNNFGVFNAAKCSSVSSSWTDSYMQ